MHFNKLDLNLLVALDALLTERSVTRAAEKLNLSPSALSNSLSRLRDYFGDELLVRIGRRMEITPRGQGLRDGVRDILLRIDATVTAAPVFDPCGSERVFRVFASDYTQLVLGPHLAALTAAQRSTAGIAFIPQVSNPQRELSRGEADLLVIPSSFIQPDQPCEALYEEHFVCVMWRDARHASGPFDAEDYRQASHVVMTPSIGSEAFETWKLRQAGLPRRILTTTYSFAALPALVVGTDQIATMHSHLARLLTRVWPLVIRPLPVPLEPMTQTMQWHEYRNRDPGVIWLRGLFQQASRQLLQDHSGEHAAMLR